MLINPVFIKLYLKKVINNRVLFTGSIKQFIIKLYFYNIFLEYPNMVIMPRLLFPYFIKMTLFCQFHLNLENY